MNARIPTRTGSKGDWRCIYCISDRSGSDVKIGYATYPDRRLAALRAETKRDLIVVWQVAGTRFHERACHVALWAMNREGEWFHDPDDRIKNLLPISTEHLMASITALRPAQARAS